MPDESAGQTGGDWDSRNLLVLVDPRPLQPLQANRLLAVHAALREAEDQPSAYVRVDDNVNARYHQKTPLDIAILDDNPHPRLYPILLRAGSPFPNQIYIKESPYLLEIQRAGGFKQYEAQVKKLLAAMLVPKFPQIPAEVIPTIVEFWAHAGDY